MSDLIPWNNKRLTLSNRFYIEENLYNGKSFRKISRYLCKDLSAISKEVLWLQIINTWNRGSFNNPYNFCIHYFVCNGCSKPRNKFMIRNKYDYKANAAQRLYEELRTSSREGISLTRKELHLIDRIVTPLISQGQSPHMILTRFPELNQSIITHYSYIAGKSCSVEIWI